MIAAPPPPTSRLNGLMVIADDDPRWGLDPVAQARAGCAGGAAVIQLRAKHATDTAVLAWSGEIRALTRAHSALFVVNDRFDLALAAEADGVHLGQDDLPPSRIPQASRERLLIGRSTHTLEEVRTAQAEPIGYVAFGPIFGTRSKTSVHAPRGISLLAQVVREGGRRPVIAIGGIDATNVTEVVQTGVAGAAVISAVVAAGDPVAATRELANAFRRSAAS